MPNKRKRTEMDETNKSGEESDTPSKTKVNKVNPDIPLANENISLLSEAKKSFARTIINTLKKINQEREEKSEEKYGKNLEEYIHYDETYENFETYKKKIGNPIESFYTEISTTALKILTIQNQYFLILKYSLGHREYQSNQMAQNQTTLDIILAQNFADRLYVVKMYRNPKENTALCDQITRDQITQKKLGQPTWDWYDEQHDTRYVVREYVPGQPLNTLIGNRAISFNKQIDIAKKIVDALNELHNQSILHCDIKPENILYDKEQDTITFIDFGISLDMTDENTKEAKTTELNGTRKFIAPELLQHATNRLFIYNEKTEVYSLGITLAEWFGVKNLDLSSSQSSMFNIPVSKEMQPTMKLLQEMTAKNPNERPTLEVAQKRLIELQQLQSQPTVQMNKS
ncbi:MAG: hypothetical protein A3F42_00050 [Gammaproteobacteria bacterium RIFCSPHIGHO2_12_FULL_37_34]|nr:MAG: hypothetical protein A3F42_00050 [Gammaproteobacteria bacterium RIFCSPHIGHO2_12_FULL_37_34]